MATYQVPSMKEGGFLWFENLVAADPYYILPLLTALTTYAVIKSGAEGKQISIFCPMVSLKVLYRPCRPQDGFSP